MNARHPMNGQPYPRQQPPQSYPGMQNARPPIPYSMPLAPGQVVPRRPPQRGPPRPGMFPAASEPAFRNLQPGDVVRSRSQPMEDAGRAGVGAGMGMAPRPYMLPAASSLSIGRGIDEAGYPVIAGVHSQPGSGQGQQQVYRVVPGMGKAAAGIHPSGQEGRLMADRMNQLSVSAPPPQSNSRPHLAQPPLNNRPAISSQASFQPSRNVSQGGSISSIRSSSTTRTTSSSNESALNLRQHYMVDPANVNANGHARAGNGAGNGAGHNPLLDLLSSEREYAEQMTCIVRVSSQWVLPLIRY